MTTILTIDSMIGAVAASAKKITDAMMAKGLVKPNANYTIDMGGAQYVSLSYEIGGLRKSECFFNFQAKEGQTIEDVALAWVAEQADADTRARQEFFRLAAAAADFAAKNLPDAGPDVDMIRDQITDQMHRLAGNALAAPDYEPPPF